MKDKTKKELIILGILTVILAVLLYAITIGPAGGGSTDEPSGGPEAQSDSGAEKRDGGETSAEELMLSEVDNVIERAKNMLRKREKQSLNAVADGRDPFGRGESSEEEDSSDNRDAGSSEELTLTAILWSPNIPMAVVNGKVVGVGDRVGIRWKVASIEPRDVKLKSTETDGREVKELSLETR
ncbi:MAG: hypothetical protein ACOC0A_03710 [Planctomycetota bacterium]